MAASNSPGPGFNDPVLDSQRTFRAVLTAMSRPGTIVPAPVLPPAPEPLHQTTAAVCLTFLDLDTPLWLDGPARTPAATAHLTFHCGCPLVGSPREAAYGLIGSGRKLPDPTLFPVGRAEFPDRSATLLIQVEELLSAAREEGGLVLSGPGIETRHYLRVLGLDSSFWGFWSANHSLFPRGVDAILISPVGFCGLPRTTRVEEG